MHKFRLVYRSIEDKIYKNCNCSGIDCINFHYLSSTVLLELILSFIVYIIYFIDIYNLMNVGCMTTYGNDCFIYYIKNNVIVKRRYNSVGKYCIHEIISREFNIILNIKSRVGW